MEKPSEQSSERKERVRTVDEEILSPEERAEFVHALIKDNFPDVTNWDLLCFSIEYTALMSQTYRYLDPYARELVQLLYAQHYYLTDKLPEADRYPREKRDRESISSHEGNTETSRPNERTGPRPNFRHREALRRKKTDEGHGVRDSNGGSKEET